MLAIKVMLTIVAVSVIAVMAVTVAAMAVMAAMVVTVAAKIAVNY